jgi:response regulator RpfG family c-di-GMP phosphodiesterase
MEGKGTHFDPDLADLFLSVADEFNRVHSEFGEDCCR